jgi:hypothetical protein
MKFIHTKMTFIYGHIHPRKWVKITLSFKLQVQNSKFKHLPWGHDEGWGITRNGPMRSLQKMATPTMKEMYSHMQWEAFRNQGKTS